MAFRVEGATSKHQRGVGQTRFIERFHRSSVLAKVAAYCSPLLKVFARLALSYGISRQPDGSVGSRIRRGLSANAQVIAQP